MEQKSARGEGIIVKRIYILCEGLTEERFVKELLIPRFQVKQIYITPIIFPTKRTDFGGRFRGGLSNYSKIAKELSILCNDHDAWVTSMLDYYQLPKETPGMNQRSGDLYADITMIERAVEADVNRTNLHVNLMVHEFESLLFSEPKCFSIVADDKAANQLCTIADQFTSPEEINSAVETAPSKRILRIIPTYKKIVDGITLAQQIGLDRMIEVCPHFAEWIGWMRDC